MFNGKALILNSKINNKRNPININNGLFKVCSAWNLKIPLDVFIQIPFSYFVASLDPAGSERGIGGSWENTWNCFDPGQHLNSPSG